MTKEELQWRSVDKTDWPDYTKPVRRGFLPLVTVDHIQTETHARLWLAKHKDTSNED